jgi:hypothetical protein
LEFRCFNYHRISKEEFVKNKDSFFF